MGRSGLLSSICKCFLGQILDKVYFRGRSGRSRTTIREPLQRLADQELRDVDAKYKQVEEQRVPASGQLDVMALLHIRMAMFINLRSVPLVASLA